MSDLLTTCRLTAVLVALGGLVGCTSTSTGSGEGMGSTLSNIFTYGGTTVPPVASNPPMEAADCPAVTVADGRSAIRSGGEGAAVRNQISIANVARECIERPDGAVVVKVGVEGRALIGPGGSSGRFGVPVTIALKRGDRVIVGRTRHADVVIPPGRAEATFTVVEGDLVVPPGTGEFDIEVGLGGSVNSGMPARRRGRRG